MDARVKILSITTSKEATNVYQDVYSPMWSFKHLIGHKVWDVGLNEGHLIKSTSLYACSFCGWVMSCVGWCCVSQGWLLQRHVVLAHSNLCWIQFPRVIHGGCLSFYLSCLSVQHVVGFIFKVLLFIYSFGRKYSWSIFSSFCLLSMNGVRYLIANEYVFFHACMYGH